VFRWPGDRSQIWVKRVIGLPGDRIAMRNGRVWINGAAVALKADGMDQAEAEDGSLQPVARFVETLPGSRSHTVFKHAGIGAFDNMPEIIFPPDSLFVMGDNRDNSADSRIAVDAGGVGLLPVGDLVGRVEALVGSWDLAVKRQPVWAWPSGFRLPGSSPPFSDAGAPGWRADYRTTPEMQHGRRDGCLIVSLR